MPETPPYAEILVDPCAPSGPFGLAPEQHEMLPMTLENDTAAAPLSATSTGSSPAPPPAGSGGVDNPAPQMLSSALIVTFELVWADATTGLPATPAAETVTDPAMTIARLRNRLEPAWGKLVVEGTDITERSAEGEEITRTSPPRR